MILPVQLVLCSAIFLLFTQVSHGDVNATDNVNCSGCWPKTPKRPTFSIDLNFDGLDAKIWRTSTLPTEGCDERFIWNLLASKLVEDARTKFGQGQHANRYDVWPKVESFAHQRWLIPSQTYAIRFSLIQEVQGVPIDRLTILAVSNIFSYMAQLDLKPDYAFSGNVSKSGTALFQMRLYSTGVSPALSNKDRDIRISDLGSINYARHHILHYTTPTDYLIFLGASGVYFYYALNRPNDSSSNKRKAYLLPMSGAGDWTKKKYLDRVLHTPQLQSFISNVLRPVFSGSQAPRSRDRIIVIDYVCSGDTIGGFREMLHAAGYSFSKLYIMNIKEPRNSYYPRGYTKLNSIKITDERQLDLIRHGGYGRVVPPYPWQYWDVPPDLVEYPDKPLAKRVIDFIRYNGGPPSSLTLPANETGNAPENSTDVSDLAINTAAATSSVDSSANQTNTETVPQYNLTGYEFANATLAHQNLSSDAVILKSNDLSGLQCSDEGDYGGPTATVPSWGCDNPDQTCVGYLGDIGIANSTLDESPIGSTTIVGETSVNATDIGAFDNNSVLATHASNPGIAVQSSAGTQFKSATIVQPPSITLTDAPTS